MNGKRSQSSAIHAVSIATIRGTNGFRAAGAGLVQERCLLLEEIPAGEARLAQLAEVRAERVRREDGVRDLAHRPEGPRALLAELGPAGDQLHHHFPLVLDDLLDEELGSGNRRQRHEVPPSRERRVGGQGFGCTARRASGRNRGSLARLRLDLGERPLSLRLEEVLVALADEVPSALPGREDVAVEERQRRVGVGLQLARLVTGEVRDGRPGTSADRRRRAPSSTPIRSRRSAG